RAVAGEDYLLARPVERVERVDELLLGLRLSLQGLDVVDEEGVDAAVAAFERLGTGLAQAADELGGEPFGRRRVDGELGPALVDVGGDRAQEVALPEARWSVQEERVVGL